MVICIVLFMMLTVDICAYTQRIVYTVYRGRRASLSAMCTHSSENYVMSESADGFSRAWLLLIHCDSEQIHWQTRRQAEYHTFLYSAVAVCCLYFFHILISRWYKFTLWCWPQRAAKEDMPPKQKRKPPAIFQASRDPWYGELQVCSRSCRYQIGLKCILTATSDMIPRRHYVYGSVSMSFVLPCNEVPVRAPKATYNPTRPSQGC